MDLLELIESLKKHKRVSSGGIVTVTTKTDKKGYKVKTDPRTGSVREVPMTPNEIRKRKMAAIKRASRNRSNYGMRKKMVMARKRRMAMGL